MNGQDLTRPESQKATGFAGAPPLISLKGITKRFGKVVANNNISLDLYPGRIKALLGENGAGKSTLMSMLAGRFKPDEGYIEVDGVRADFNSSKDAIKAGVGMVYQHFMLVETMTVAENVLLGQEGSFFINHHEMRERVRKLASDYELEIDPAARISDLSMGEKQRVEILKLLYRESRVLIFDEPTAVLTPREAFRLFEALWTMTRLGKSVVFISHKLEEVLAIADEVAILRRGKIDAEVPRDKILSKADLACRMVGKEVLLEIDKEEVEVGEKVLEVKNMTGMGLRGISLDVHKGEIVAIVGVAGNGQQELVEGVSGLRKPPEDTIFIMNKPWRKFFAEMTWNHSMSYIPEDRLDLATARNLDLVDNLLLTTRQGFTAGSILQRDKAAVVAAELVKDYDVRPGRLQALAWQLSGGNLQKMVLARELYRQPHLIVAEQPTQGLDISATEEVWNKLLEARKMAGILLVTGDLGEAIQLADRIAVMYCGQIMDEFHVSNTEKLDNIGLLMAGVKE